MLKKIGNIVFFIIVFTLISMTALSLLRGQPTGAVAVRSWSMEPMITRGDLAIIWPATKKSIFSQDQIIVFRSEENGVRDWTLHRIVGGNAADGFITKGDNNDETDQDGSRFPLIQKEWIAAIVPTIGNYPLKIPLLGHIPLYLQENMNNSILLPIALGLIVGILLLDELFKSRKRRKKEKLQSSQLYFLAGLVFTFLMGTLMLTSSLFINMPYGVDNNEGVLMGSSVGVLKQGESREITLAELENKGQIPSFYYAVSSDPQVTLQQNAYPLGKGEYAEVQATVNAQQLGMHEAKVAVGMFLPFLPPAVIAYLAKINIWLAFVVVSIIPAIPLFILPFLVSHRRKSITHKWRKRLSTIKLPFLPS